MKSNTLSWSNPTDIQKIKSELAQNRLVVGTSDTVLGLLAPLTKQGFLALNAIKGRERKPYVILVESFQTAQNLIEKSFQIEKFSKFWPAPLTLVCNAKKELPDYLKSSNNTIAIRVPDHQGLLALLSGLPGLYSTSANKSGQPVPFTLDAIDPDIVNHVSYLIADDTISQLPSTIIDCTGQIPTVIREGAFPLEELRKEDLL